MAEKKLRRELIDDPDFAVQVNQGTQITQELQRSKFPNLIDDPDFAAPIAAVAAPEGFLDKAKRLIPQEPSIPERASETLPTFGKPEPLESVTSKNIVDRARDVEVENLYRQAAQPKTVEPEAYDPSKHTIQENFQRANQERAINEQRRAAVEADRSVELSKMLRGESDATQEQRIASRLPAIDEIHGEGYSTNIYDNINALFGKGLIAGGAGAIGGAIRGRDTSEADTWLERAAQNAIDFSNDYLERARAENINPTISSAGQSVGYSVATMAPMAIPYVGNVISFGMMYRGAQNQFMNQMRKEYEAKYGNVSDEAWNKKSKSFDDELRNYGLWEAIPEYASDKLFLGILGKTFGTKAVGGLTRKFGTYYGMQFANESPSEAATNLGQEIQAYDAQKKLGISAGRRPDYAIRDFIESYGKVAPSVALSTLILGGAGGVLTSAMKDNKAVKAAVDTGSPTIIDSMARVAPRAATIISEMKAKAADVEQPTAMSEAFAKAKVNRRKHGEEVSLNRRTRNQAGYFGDVTLGELAESLGTEVLPEGQQPVSQLPKEAERKTTVKTVVQEAKAELKKLQQQKQLNNGALIKAEKALGVAKAVTEEPKLGTKIPEVGMGSNFQTSKGSSYIVHPDGTTTRTKAERSDVGHEGDFGVKKRSEKTVYLDAKLSSALAIPQDVRWRIVDNGNGTVSLAIQNKDGKWGISPSAKNVDTAATPKTGLVPLELWGKEKLNGHDVYNVAHFGNTIVESEHGSTSTLKQEEVPFESRTETQKKIKERLTELSKKEKLTPEEVQEVIKIASDEIRAVDETLARTKPVVAAKEPVVKQPAKQPEIDEASFAQQRHALAKPEKQKVKPNLADQTISAEIVQHRANKFSSKIFPTSVAVDLGAAGEVAKEPLTGPEVVKAKRAEPETAVLPAGESWEVRDLKQKVADAEKLLAQYPDNKARKIQVERAKKALADKIGKPPFDYATDMLDETKELGRIARQKGFKSVDEFAKTKPEEFAEVAKQWRQQHPVPQLRMPKVEQPEAEYSGRAQADTPAFKKWFGDSKVVDAEGKPLVVYHGTQADFTEFDTKKMYSGEGATQSGSGFYFTTKAESASNYAIMKGDEGSKVLPVYLSIKKPLHINFRDGEVFGAEHKFTRSDVKKILMLAPDIKSKEDSPLMNFGDIEYEGFNKVLNEAIDAYAGSNNFAALRNDFFGDNHKAWLDALNKVLGYDGAYSKLDDGTIHYVAWRPEQIKSATGNIGTFDPFKASILEQKEEPYQTTPVKPEYKKASIEEQIKRQEQEQKELEENAKYDSVMQKEEKYEADQKDQAEPDIYEGLPVRPGTTEKQKQLGRDAYRDILSAYARRAGATVLGSRIAKDFQEQGGTALHGQIAETPEDFAVLAQVLRDPRWEKVRFFYTQDDKIVGHDAFSTNNPGQAGFVKKHPNETEADAHYRTFVSLRRSMNAVEANGFWVVHNHPAGKADPSVNDVRFTQYVSKMIPGFKGHIVIDHNEYAHITSSGDYKVFMKQMPDTISQDAEIPHNLLGSKIKINQDIIAIAKQLERKKGWFTLIGRSGTAEVTALAEFPSSLLKVGAVRELRLHATMKRFAQQTGSTNIVAVAGDRADLVPLERLVNQGFMLDAVDANGYSARDYVTKAPSAVEAREALFGRSKVMSVDAQEEQYQAQTETTAFKKWFGNSKVVDAKGTPVVVYHGAPDARFMQGDATFKNLNEQYGRQGGERAFWFASSRKTAGTYANDLRAMDYQNSVPGIVSAYLSLQNPLIVDGMGKEWREAQMRGKTSDVIEQARIGGHDGVIIRNVRDDYNNAPSTKPTDTYVVFSSNQIKSATGNIGTFDPFKASILEQEEEEYNTRPPKIIGHSGRKYTDAQVKAMERTGSVLPRKSIKETLQGINKYAWGKFIQTWVDQFRPVRDMDQHAYALMRLSKGATGAFEAFMRYGKLSIKDGATDAAKGGGVLDKVFYPLGRETDDFLRWISGNRAERLKQVGREHLFTDEDIAAFKSLADGKTEFDYTLADGTVTRNRKAIYADSLLKFNEFNRNVLDIAQESGLVDKESRALWEHEFYVPFYRVAEENEQEVRGMYIKGGVLRQEAFKKLTGGKEQLNDLLSNTLLNWHHLIDASAKNRAATATMQAAEKIGAARKAEPGEAKTVWIMENGEKVQYKIEDPALVTALASLEYAGMRGIIWDVLSKPKFWLTAGVTASPYFKVRNLIRDSVQAIATADLSYNVGKNVLQGFKLTQRKNPSQEYVSALAGGGLIRFGTMIEGNEAARTRMLIKQGTKDETILDSESKLQSFYDRHIEPTIAAYNELGNRGEEINRMSLYHQLREKGMDHAEASLAARDLLDFSMQGSGTAVRALSQVVPFFNARLQGMYKLGRAAKDDKARFATVLGATSLMSLALLAAYYDDEDWKKREDWDRDNYWWFKFGGIAYRIPKPFEIGAIATVTERTAEALFDNEMTGKRFRETTTNVLMNQLSMNPVPQAVKPIVDLYANKDSFTGRPIESMGMERLEPEYRYTQGTSLIARGASTAVGGALSPVQVDHLVRAYFGWLGATSVSGADMLIRSVSDQPTKPAVDYWKLATGGMVADVKSSQSRYVTQMYEQSKELEQAYGTWKRLIKEGKTLEAGEYFAENKEEIGRYKSVAKVKRIMSILNERIRSIERSDKTAEEKRELINEIRETQNRIAKQLAR